MRQLNAQEMRNLAQLIKENTPEGLGFCLLTFVTGENDIPANYISNCERVDMIKEMREVADRIEKNQDFSTPEPKAKLKCIGCGLKVPDTFELRAMGCPSCGEVLINNNL